MLLPAVLAAVGILAYFTFRTTLAQVERLRQRVRPRSPARPGEREGRTPRSARLIEQDDVSLPRSQNPLPDLTELPSPFGYRRRSVRHYRLHARDPGARRGAHWSGRLRVAREGRVRRGESFRRLLVQRMCMTDMGPREATPPDELCRHLPSRVPRPELPRQLLAADRARDHALERGRRDSRDQDGSVAPTSSWPGTTSATS